MKHKIFLFLCLLLACMAFGGHALAEEYMVYIGATPLTVADDGAAAYLKNGGDAGTESDYNAKLWYDTAAAALTLEIKDLNAEGSLDYSYALQGSSTTATLDMKRCAGIYADAPLTLVLTGESTVTGVEYDETYNWNAAGASVVNYLCDSNAYGLYCADLTITGSGTLNVGTSDIDGSTYALYSTGDVTVTGGTLKATAGQVINISRLWNQKSIAIWCEGAFLQENGVVHAEGQYAQQRSCGLYAKGGVTVNDGALTAIGATANKNWSNAIYALDSAIVINGGTVSATSGDAGSTTSAIFAGDDSTSNNPAETTRIVINGGEVSAWGGGTVSSFDPDQARAIYSEYQIDITGGTVKAYGGTTGADFSYGVGAYDDIVISGGNVTSMGGAASYSVGLYCDYNLTISGDAVVYAESAASGVRGYSYGTWVWKDLLVKDNAKFTSISGPVNDTDTSLGQKRSFGIYLGLRAVSTNDTSHNSSGTHKLQITGGTVIAISNGTYNGTVTDGNGDTTTYRSHAVVFYDAQQIEFANDAQPDDKWYQWRVSDSDEMTLSTDEVYPYSSADYWESPTQYFHVEPISLAPVYKQVTFRVVNGTWADGTTEDIVVQIPLVDENDVPDVDGSGDLSAYIPTGMLASKGYEGGAWDAEPPQTVTGADSVVYTYTFTLKEPVYKQVTFRVVNGTWADGTTEDIVVMVPLVDEDGYPDANGTGTLDVPTGMIPNEGYDPDGYWDMPPPLIVRGTDPAVYTYFFIELPPEIILPQTGDSNHRWLWLLMLEIGAVGIVLAAGRFARRKRNG